jgi:hypothetical protein
LRDWHKTYANRAIAADEGDAYAHVNLGSALITLGRLEEGQHHLELALSLNPHFPNTTIILGCAIAFGGQHREGMAMIDRAFRLEPRLSPTMRGVPFLVRCIMGDPDGAKSDLLNIDIDRPRAHLHLFMAACLASSGRVAEAKSHVLAFEAKRPPWFDVVGFTQWVGKALALSEDKERFREGLSTGGAVSVKSFFVGAVESPRAEFGELTTMPSASGALLRHCRPVSRCPLSEASRMNPA